MSRVLPLFSGKRKQSTSSASQADSSPEKAMDGQSSNKKGSRGNRLSFLGDAVANGSPQKGQNGSTAGPGLGMRRHPSAGDVNSDGLVPASFAPDAHLAQAGHSRSGNASLDERGVGLGGDGGGISSSSSTSQKRRSTLSTHSTAGRNRHSREVHYFPEDTYNSRALPTDLLAAGGSAQMPRSTSMSSATSSASNGTGGGALLSLDTLVPTDASQAMLTPKPRHDNLTNLSAGQQMFAVNGKEIDEASFAAHQQQQVRHYPPVFEGSDVPTSSSSSSTSSPVLGITTANSTGRMPDTYFPGGPIINTQRTASNESGPGQGHARAATDAGTSGPSRSSMQGSSLAPSDAGESGRGRSNSASSLASQVSQRSSSLFASPRTRKVSNGGNGKKGKNAPGPGIASALALSGVALAAPGPGMSQPIKPVPQHRVSSESYPVLQSSSKEGSRAPSMAATAPASQLSFSDHGRPPPVLVSRSSEEASGYDSPTPLSNYTPNDSPKYEDDAAYQAMVSIDALGDFDDVMSQLGAGYALASSKRNADFHSIFKNVPEDDYLIEDYGCALQREILIQGRLYISEHHLCFNANIFGWVTTVIVPFNEVVAIEKRNTALVIPNAIQITTLHARHTWASFISRDMTYDLIVSLWRNQHPLPPPSVTSRDPGATDDDDEVGLSNLEDTDGHATGDAEKKKGLGGRKKRRGFRKNKGGSESVPGIMEVEEGAVLSPSNGNGDSLAVNALKARASLGASQLSKKLAVAHPPTQCNCAAAIPTGPHLNINIMDTTFPGSPEKIYNLIFTSGFMKNFLTTDMKLTELQISDWAPQKTGSHLLTRTYNYIKPLNAPVGPKQAKCVLIDENLHVDFDDFVVTLTTTRTPEVPSGGSFSVKTKTCLMWAKNNSTRVLVTSAVEWTGRSFIKGIIDRSSMDGQRALYEALEQSMRAYISQHKSEFYEGGEEPASGENGSTDAQAESVEHDKEGSSATARAPADGTKAPQTAEVTRTDEPLAFVSDRVPVLKPMCDFLTTLYDTIQDVIGQMSVTALVCSAIIFVLVVSNIFTLSSLRKKSSRYIPSRRPPPDYSSSGVLGSSRLQQSGTTIGDAEPHDVVRAVRSVLQEYFEAQKTGMGTASIGADARPLTSAEEVKELRDLLDQIDGRVSKLRASLQDLD